MCMCLEFVSVRLCVKSVQIHACVCVCVYEMCDYTHVCMCVKFVHAIRVCAFVCVHLCVSVSVDVCAHKVCVHAM